MFLPPELPFLVRKAQGVCHLAGYLVQNVVCREGYGVKSHAFLRGRTELLAQPKCVSGKVFRPQSVATVALMVAGMCSQDQ